jgi:hypothetical protein
MSNPKKKPPVDAPDAATSSDEGAPSSESPPPRASRRKKDVLQEAIDRRPQPRDEEMEMLEAVKERLKQINTDDPDPDELTELREILTVFPHLREVLADVGGGLLEQLIMVSRSTPLGRQALSIHVDQMRHELGSGRGSVVDSLLGDELLASWLHHQHAQQQSLDVTNGSATLATYRLLDQRRGATQAQFLRAVDAFKRQERHAGDRMVYRPHTPTDRQIEVCVADDLAD